jgi:hypothetical protein
MRFGSAEHLSVDRTRVHEFTLILRGARSIAAALVIPLNAHFVALYAIAPGDPRSQKCLLSLISLHSRLIPAGHRTPNSIEADVFRHGVRCRLAAILAAGSSLRTLNTPSAVSTL